MTLMQNVRFLPVVAALLIAMGGLIGTARAGVILPVDVTKTGFPPLSNSPVTLSIFLDGTDITDAWVPKWQPGTGGQSVFVVVNVNGTSTIPTSISLVPPPAPGNIVFNRTDNPFLKAVAPNTVAPTTSAYPGNCMNFGSPSDLTADVTLETTGTPIATATGQKTGFRLTPQDCGAMAVIRVTVSGSTQVSTFIAPQDSNVNGIPDVWEAVFCPPTSPCPTGREDNDVGPVAGSAGSDGIAAFDEYRCCIVSGEFRQADPRQRDFFVHITNPQCLPVPPPGTDLTTYFLSSMQSLLGGGAKVFPTDGTPLTQNLASVLSASQVHLLGGRARSTSYKTDEWVDNFVAYSETTGFVYDPATDGAISDRQINRNAIYPMLDTKTGRRIQKGLRIVECLDASTLTTLGFASIGLLNGTGAGHGNAVIYSQRIAQYLTNLLQQGGQRSLRYFAFVSGAWTRLFESARPPTQADIDIIISRGIQFYTSMEGGHVGRLTPTVEGTRQTSYGYHHAPGTGSNLDQTIINTRDKSTSGFNSFYIPLLYNGTDLTNFRLKD
jgi:hypothetical protein